MDITCLVFAVPVLFFGLEFFQGKALSHSRTWRAMSEEDKATVNLNLVNKNLGCIVCACGVLLLASGLFEGIRGILGPLFAVWALAALADAIYISKSKRFVNSNAVTLAR